MTSEPARIAPFKYLPAEVALDPVYNVLNSLALLNMAGQGSDLGEWAVRTAAALAPEQQRANRLLFEGLPDALAPDQEWPNFPAYLDSLAALNPFALRDRLLQRVFDPLPSLRADRVARAEPQAPVDVREYVANVERLHPGARIDHALHAELQALLDDPPALHDLIVAHLDQLWEAALAAEWQRALRGPVGLQNQLGVFERRLSTTATAAETFRTLTGRALPADLPMPAVDVQRIILVPAPHNGRHLTTWYSDAILRIFFSAPPNYALLLRSSEIGAAELRARLNALADDTRLRILALLAQHHELSAQEIIARLDLSQSSVSRHLKQLTATGYLFERRGSGANKIYSLSTLNLDGTIRVLEQLLAGAYTFAESQPTDDSARYPQELKRFLDGHGRIANWPSKQRDRLPLLDYLAAQFEPGRFYSEREVNAILIAHIAFQDYVTLRRELYDYHFINRDRNGARYWRAEPTPAEPEQAG